ncbi:3-hydroxyacyl-CoA dehydrogenase NAD-binding domain-containing protein [Algoriphagus boritolerans]|uniref:3-hydroxyacyl-CoA dehydrogenase NAD-binding domain-containing protein n=1 Tax=Algoriphagus boritolerans TaxID=308111 RepID=UPI000AEC4D37
MKIKNICILGAGTLGSRVALQAAISGYIVTVYDVEQKSLDFSLATMQKLLGQFHKSGQLSKGQEREVLGRIKFTLDPMEAVDDADFINESVTEEADVKKESLASVWENRSQKDHFHYQYFVYVALYVCGGFRATDTVLCISLS